jgi:ATP-dependent DNA helicase DinG
VEEDGGSGFRDVLLPEAVLRFRQGVGRLVRRATDRGVVVIADPRAVTRSYGAVFRAALPVPLARAGGVGDLVERAAAFFAAGPGPAGEGEPG